MPIGEPPPVTLPESVFNALKAMTYSSGGKCFVSGGTNYYLFVEKDTNTTCCARWGYGTSTDGAANPRPEVPQAVHDLIQNGTYVGNTKTIDYEDVSHVLRMERDTNGAYVVKIVVF